MNKKMKNLIIPLIGLGLLISSPVFAVQTSTVVTHEATGVSSSSATLNGEITQTGGCWQINVWFQYGETAGYGQQTPQVYHPSIGSFSAYIGNLSPCTLYHFQAVAENNVGVSYGADRTFTTDCPCPDITVDIKANGSDGPITIDYDSSASLTWSSANADSCSASGDWSGSKGTSGTEGTGNLTSIKTYTITCTSACSCDSVSDTVTVNVSSPPCPPPPCPDITVDIKANGSDGPITIDYDSSASLTWSSANADSCSASGDWSGSKGTSGTEGTGNLTSIKTYTITCTSACDSASDTVTVNVASPPSPPGENGGNGGGGEVYRCPTPSVELTANGADETVGIAYNTSATLSWVSHFANFCDAPKASNNGWAGSKHTFGSEETGNLTSSRTYTIVCTSACGEGSDSVTINMASLEVEKMVRHLANGGSYVKAISAEPDELISFQVKITAVGTSFSDVTVEDVLPKRIIYQGNLEIDGVPSDEDITSGLNLGNLSAEQTITITFEAKIEEAGQFSYGQTELINTASARSMDNFGSDTAEVTVSKKEVAGATSISTALTNNIFLDSFFLPLSFTLLIIYLIRSHIVRFEEWLDKRKKTYRGYKAQKILQLKTSRARLKEKFFQISR